MNQMVKSNKDKNNNNSSNSLVFGPWAQAKIGVAFSVTLEKTGFFNYNHLTLTILSNWTQKKINLHLFVVMMLFDHVLKCLHHQTQYKISKWLIKMVMKA